MRTVLIHSISFVTHLLTIQNISRLKQCAQRMNRLETLVTDPNSRNTNIFTVREPVLAWSVLSVMSQSSVTLTPSGGISKLVLH